MSLYLFIWQQQPAAARYHHSWSFNEVTQQYSVLLPAVAAAAAAATNGRLTLLHTLVGMRLPRSRRPVQRDHDADQLSAALPPGHGSGRRRGPEPNRPRAGDVRRDGTATFCSILTVSAALKFSDLLSHIFPRKMDWSVILVFV